jgi:hypothetical protein
MTREKSQFFDRITAQLATAAHQWFLLNLEDIQQQNKQKKKICVVTALFLVLLVLVLTANTNGFYL